MTQRRRHRAYSLKDRTLSRRTCFPVRSWVFFASYSRDRVVLSTYFSVACQVFKHQFDSQIIFHPIPFLWSPTPSWSDQWALMAHKVNQWQQMTWIDYFLVQIHSFDDHPNYQITHRYRCYSLLALLPCFHCQISTHLLHSLCSNCNMLHLSYLI